MVSNEVISYHNDFKIPENQVANYLVRILNPKYRLRSSPAINEDNVRAELEEGKLSYSFFSEAEDENWPYLNFCFR